MLLLVCSEITLLGFTAERARSCRKSVLQYLAVRQTLGCPAWVYPTLESCALLSGVPAQLQSCDCGLAMRKLHSLEMLPSS